MVELVILMKAFCAKGANHVQKVQAQATVLPLAIHVISRSNHQAFPVLWTQSVLWH